MKIKSFTVGTIIALMTISCSNNSNQISNSDSSSNENNDTIISGTITQMWWDSYQGMSDGGITLDNKKNLTISTDYLGENNSGRIFINPEVSDILFLEKEKDNERLNTNYLNKNAKVTFDKKTSTIKKIDLIGGEKPIKEDSSLINGYVLGMNRDKNSGMNFITFKDETGKEEKIRLYIDNEGHYTLTSIYHGEGKKSESIFYIDGYSLSITPNNTEKRVLIKKANKMVTERNTSNGNRVSLSFEPVILDIVWDKTSNTLTNE
jgi:hypothetical protein